MSALEQVIESCENLGNVLIPNGNVFFDSNTIEKCRSLKTTKDKNQEKNLQNLEEKIFGTQRKTRKEKYNNQRTEILKRYETVVENIDDVLKRYKNNEITKSEFDMIYKKYQQNVEEIVKDIEQFRSELYSNTNKGHSKSEEIQYKSLVNLLYKKSSLTKTKEEGALLYNTAETRLNQIEIEFNKTQGKYRRNLLMFLCIAVFNIILLLWVLFSNSNI